MYEGPILDNHLHLDPIHGQGVEAAIDFANAGGTHLLVLNKPSWSMVSSPEYPDAFRETFEITIEVTTAAAAHLPGNAWPVLGVHPALISQLVENGCTESEAATIMKSGIDIAAEYVADGPALAIKSGRPHYEVRTAIWDVSNDVMRHAFSRAAEVGCAVQLHTESGTDFSEIASWAEEQGLPPEQVVKHYADGPITGAIPSVIARKDALEKVQSEGTPFLMETDFIDDPDRPGAVLGPKTVPKRTKWLVSNGLEDVVNQAHIDTPARVYGIDTKSTLQS